MDTGDSMTTATIPPALVGHSPVFFPRTRTIIYWVATLFVVGNGAVAGTMNILRIQPLFGMLLHLGYPAYFATVLGIWKVLGSLALVAPRYPRLKEWAYAGMFIDYTAAVASYAAVGEGVASNLAFPIISIVFLVASWALRPSSRRVGARG
jgi:uncharacterized membrane protein YphA (DoxX/SURF4 family)